MVQVFAGAGARVIVLDRPDLDAKALPNGTGWLGVDLNDLAAIQGQATAAGPFDILVNNAALIINRPFEEFSLEDDEEQLRVKTLAWMGAGRWRRFTRFITIIKVRPWT